MFLLYFFCHKHHNQRKKLNDFSTTPNKIKVTPMNKKLQYVIPFESYKALLEIQGLADGINKNAEEIYEYDIEALAKELLSAIREIRQKTSDVFESAQPAEVNTQD